MCDARQMSPRAAGHRRGRWSGAQAGVHVRGLTVATTWLPWKHSAREKAAQLTPSLS